MSRPTSPSQERNRGSLSAETGNTSPTKKTSPYDRVFEQMMIDQGIYPDGHEDENGATQEPRNFDKICERLARRRSSLSPSRWSESEFKRFKRSNVRSRSESRAMITILPLIAGSKDLDYETAGDRPFNNMEKFHPSITAPKPDLYYGAKPSQIDSRVRNDIGQYITPSTDTALPAAPNNFLVGKSKSGDADVARRQAMYDGTIGARGMFELQNYGNPEPVYDGNAYSIASSFHPGMGTLQIYATHPAPPTSSGGNPQYYTTELEAYAMTGNVNKFRAGATAYRNAREWTQEQRDRLITKANAVAQGQSSETGSFEQGEGTDVSSNGAEESDNSDASTSSRLHMRKRQRREAPS